MALPLINGNGYGSANVQVIIPPLGPVIGITAIEYKKDVDIQDNFGLGPDPVSRVYGQNKYTGKIAMYKEVWNKVMSVSPQGDPTLLPPFNIKVIYTAVGQATRVETLRSVSFKTVPVTVNSGDTKMIVDVDLAIGNIDFV